MMIDRKRLKVLLAERDLLQWQLAAQLGLSASAFSNYVRGTHRPPKSFLYRLEQALGFEPGTSGLDA